MNKPIRTISIFCLLLFVALMVNATWLQYWKSDAYDKDPRNRRVIEAAYSRDRGAILVGQEPVAESVDSDDKYDYLRSYSPYENVRAQRYPWMLVTSSLNDSQVGFHEPTKWVAKLRATKTDANPLLFRINMAGGHGGSSGRYDVMREQAFRYAFMIDAVRQQQAGAVP